MEEMGISLWSELENIMCYLEMFNSSPNVVMVLVHFDPAEQRKVKCGEYPFW